MKEILTDEIGMASLVLGGGRVTKDSKIDLSVGIIIHKNWEIRLQRMSLPPCMPMMMTRERKPKRG